MQERWPVLESPALSGGRHPVEELDGTDALNQPFRYRLLLQRRHAPILSDSGEALMHSGATLVFRLGTHEVQRVFGIASAVDIETDAGGETSAVRIELVPRMWLLTQRHGNRVFVARSVPEVIAEVLGGIGLKEGDDFVMALQQRYPVRELVVQHDETDLAFVSRLTEHLGIIWHVEHRDGRDVVAFFDTQDAFARIAGAGRIAVRDRRSHPAAYAVTSRLRRVPAEVVVHDYNYRAPRLALNHAQDTQRAAAAGLIVEYGAHTKSAEETLSIATARQQAIAAQHLTVSGMTTEEGMFAGGLFTLVDGAGEERELLLTRVDYRFRGVEDAHESDAWQNAFSALERATPYRPPRITPRPRVPGMVNAIVDGAIHGPYAELDEAGRYHVRLMYDRSGRTNLTASHPVRMMQPHAGAHYGMHFPLRPGTEVLIGFVNGDPDRPVIVGTVPNPETASPVDRDNQTQNVLRTGSSNELVIEDELGRERIRLHTPHQMTTIQLGSEDESEIGALTVTEAHITEASRLSNNELTAQKTLLAERATSVLGHSAVWWVGSPALAAATAAGLNRSAALPVAAIGADVGRLAAAPGELPDPEEPAPDDPAPEPPPTGGGLFSSLGADVRAAADEAAHDLVRGVAEHADRTLDGAKGRLAGEPLGQPLAPSAIVASASTSAVMARDRALFFGEHAASLSSADTAAVSGARRALVKSPEAVEIAAGEELKLTTAGELDAASHTLRLVAGYYPQAEAPPLDDGTSIGVMSRHDLRFISVEDCILVCAKKNLIGSAHTGDIRLTAAQTVAIEGASITGSAGYIGLSSGGDLVAKADGDATLDCGGNITVTAGGDVTIDAGGAVHIKGATVTLEGGSITLKGNTTVEGDLTVTGAIHGG